MLPTIGLIILGGWWAALCFAPFLARRYVAVKAWGWLVLMLVLPWIGIGFYLLLGRNPLGRKQVVQYRNVVASCHAEAALREIQSKADTVSLCEEAASMSRLAVSGGAFPPVAGNTVRFLDFQETLDTLLGDIQAAETQVHLCYYIFRDDDAGRRVADALAEAARRGVTCRVLADAFGSRRMFRRLAPAMIRAGVEVHPSLPVNPLRRKFSRLDVRNHRKIAVIDGHTAYLGSWNIGEGRVGTNPSETYQDLTLHTQGPVVAQVQVLFHSDWCFETRENTMSKLTIPPPATPSGSILQVAPSGPMYPSPSFRDIVVYCLHQAKHRICITTPYFVPDRALLLAIRLAVQRGVDVQLIVPASTDHLLVDSVGRSYIRELHSCGVSVYFHKQGVLHTKEISIDDTVAIVGSGNLDLRSFRLNVEANMLLYSKDSISQIHRREQTYIAQSELLEDQHIRQWGRIRRLAYDTARLFGPLM